MEKKDDPALRRRIKRVGAGRGKRSPKSGQSDYFLGYKKHTVRGFFPDHGKWRSIPLFSLARAARVNEVELTKSLLNFVRRKLADLWPMTFVVGDKGYISARHGRFLRERWQVALVVKPRRDMKPPAATDAEGCPLCPSGEALVWEGYDGEDGALLYVGNSSACRRCPLSGNCAKRWEFPAGAHETFWGMVPSHTRLAKALLRAFRPLCEPGFSTAKNRLRLKDFFLNSRELAQMLCILCDLVEALEILAKERPLRGRETKNAILREIKQPEIWD